MGYQKYVIMIGGKAAMTQEMQPCAEVSQPFFFIMLFIFQAV